MRKFNVNVNGTVYTVEVEEVGGAVTAPAPAAKPAAAAPAGSVTVSAPMPGKILSVNVKPGDKVEAGDVLLILEAMKMQNEIMAPEDGTVSEVRVNAGDTVATGDVMVIL